MAKLTVMTNLYNEQANLVSFLDSLRAQTLDEFHVLLVDDGSTDDSVQVIREHMDGLDVELVELPYVGLFSARAAGMDRVDTELCAVLDADEILHQDCLANMVMALEDPLVGAVSGYKVSMGRGWVVRGGSVLMEGALDAMRRPDGTAEHLAGGCYAVRTKLVRELGGLATDGSSDDADLALRLRELGYKVLLSKDIIVYHRDPETLWGMIKWGAKMGRIGFYTNWKYRRRLFRWHQLVKFAPLGMLLLLIIYWPGALVALLGSCLAFLFYLRGMDHSLMDKLIGWLVFWLKSLGWDIGFLAALFGFVFQRQKTQTEQA